MAEIVVDSRKQHSRHISVENSIVVRLAWKVTDWQRKQHSRYRLATKTAKLADWHRIEHSRQVGIETAHYAVANSIVGRTHSKQIGRMAQQTVCIADRMVYRKQRIEYKMV